MSTDPSLLDSVEKLVHIFGIPGLIGVIIWLVRTFDAGQRQLKAIDDNSKLTVITATAVKEAVDIMQTNHLAHVAEDIKSLHGVQAKTVEVLTSIDRGIAVLVDRSPRQM